MSLIQTVLQKKNKSYEKHYKTLIEMPAVQTDEAVTLYKFALKSLYEVLKQDFNLIKDNAAPTH